MWKVTVRPFVQVISLMLSVGGACVVVIFSNKHDSNDNSNISTDDIITSTGNASHDKTTPLGIMVSSVWTNE